MLSRFLLKLDIAKSAALIDKENAQNRKGIFMIDAGKGFIKDGNKNS